MILRGQEGSHIFILRKIFSSRTSKPISIKLGTNHPWVKGILNCSNKGSILFKGDIITKM
jgi:hypothetical protein